MAITGFYLVAPNSATCSETKNPVTSKAIKTSDDEADTKKAAAEGQLCNNKPTRLTPRERKKTQSPSESIQGTKKNQ